MAESLESSRWYISNYFNCTLFQAMIQQWYPSNKMSCVVMYMYMYSFATRILEKWWNGNRQIVITSYPKGLLLRDWSHDVVSCPQILFVYTHTHTHRTVTLCSAYTGEALWLLTSPCFTIVTWFPLFLLTYF